MKNYERREREALARVEAAIAQFRAGKAVIMVDDEDRENEGDLVIAAEDADAAATNLMATEARGLICLSLHESTVERLQLPMMVDRAKSQPRFGTAFTVSIEARQGVTTGISAHDRAHTIAVAINPQSGPEDLSVPGHIFPLRARAGGVLERAGHTEGAVDLALLAGKQPAAVICEVMDRDGSMARGTELNRVARRLGLPLVSIEDLITYRLHKETLVECVGQRSMASRFGTLELYWFRNKLKQTLHIALCKGGPFTECDLVAVRVHKQDLLQELPLAQLLQNEASSLFNAGLEVLTHEKATFLYLASDEALQPWLQQLQDGCAPEAQNPEPKLYGIGAQILKTLGIRRMDLWTRSHKARSKALTGLKAYGLSIEKNRPIKKGLSIAHPHH